MRIVKGVKNKTCRRGHPRTEENVYIAPKNGIMECRQCRKLRPIKHYQKNKFSSPEAILRNRQQNDKYLFGGNREKAIQRDGEKCAECSLTREEHVNKYGPDITVDHIDGNRKNNSLTNLRTLCLSCHGKKDVARRKVKPVLAINLRSK